MISEINLGHFRNFLDFLMMSPAAAMDSEASPRGQSPPPSPLPPGSGTDKLILLDAGAQFGKVIDRKCRELKVIKYFQIDFVSLPST